MEREKERKMETGVERKRWVGCGFAFLVEGGRAKMEREKVGERAGEKKARSCG